MIPPLIVHEALERGILLIAITDHNASSNVPAVQKAAAGSGLTVMPGMEVQTREEVHVLCLFDTLEQMSAWQAVVDRFLPQLKGYPLLQGGDAHRLDEFLGVNEFRIAAPTVAEIRLALRGQEGRSLLLRSTTNGQPSH
jgi:predicted metal-dependent phosphoesterase TrpH